MVLTSERLKCPQCSGFMHLKQSRHGPFFGCENWPQCDATHSAHKATCEPMGVPGDKETKLARRAAHEAFDDIWKTADSAYDLSQEPPNKRPKIERNIQVRMRTRCYHWLAHELKIGLDECHIGSFDKETCATVVTMCKLVSPVHIREWAKERGL